MTELVLVRAAECRPVRRAVLRPAASEADCAFPGDDDERTLHFAVKQGRKVLGVLTLLHEERAGLGSEVWRVRGPAVAEGARRNGVGRQLLLAAQAVAEKRGGGAWCRVPEASMPFFAAHGFRDHVADDALDGDGEDATAGDGVEGARLMTWRPVP